MNPALDARMLHLAARLALRGAGRVEPNPLVGCVLAQGTRVIGMGHHRVYGSFHAEAEAIADARGRGEPTRGATAYVTLEPCAAHGQQPPCTDALIRAGVSRVVFARSDPNPAKAGGAAVLAAAGIPAQLSDASPLATGVGAPFAKRVQTGLPWVIAKWAQTIDGRVATRTGESKWISGETARRRVHRLRARVDAILTGVGTVLADDPMLTARGVPIRRRALRVVVDADLDTPPDAQLVRTARAAPTVIACDQEVATAAAFAGRRDAIERAGVRLVGVPASPAGRGLDLRAVLHALAKSHAVCTVLIEAGPGILGSVFECDLADEAVVYVAPLLLGDEMARAAAVGRVAESLSEGRRFSLWRAKPLGGDVELTYRAKENRAQPAHRHQG